MEVVHRVLILLTTPFILGSVICWLVRQNLIVEATISKSLDPNRAPDTHVNEHRNDIKIPKKISVKPLAADVRSPLYLLELAKYEIAIVDLLTRLESDAAHLIVSNSMEQIERYLDHYTGEILSAEHFTQESYKPKLISENPVLVFNMLWRFVYVIPKLREMLIPFSEVDDEVRDFVAGNNEKITLPTSNVIEEAMAALLRIHMVYDLDPSELSSGIIYGVKTGAQLSIYQMLAIGLFARDAKKYTLAVSWIELTLKKLKDPNARNMYNISSNSVQEILKDVMTEHDSTVSTRELWENFYYQDKLLIRGRPNPKRVPVRKSNLKKFRRRNGVAQNEINYWGLCSGENHQTETEKSRLICWYDGFSDPILYINPVKVELVSESPYIEQMYDVITDSISNKFVELSRSNFRRSEVIDTTKVGSAGFLSDVRTSVEHWIKDPFLRFHKFIEAISGLRVMSPTSSQPFLVTSYAFGGHYECHLDAFEPNNVNPETGNRMATMIFYLNDTLKGGFTAFPVAGVAIRPIKGSAVFFYNMLQNGERDERTYHCACPVVLGHKTITTKWIMHHDQFQHRQCSLLEDE